MHEFLSAPFCLIYPLRSGNYVSWRLMIYGKMIYYLLAHLCLQLILELKFLSSKNEIRELVLIGSIHQPTFDCLLFKGKDAGMIKLQHA